MNPPRITEALGRSEPFLLVQERLSRVAAVNRPVLILGERGTGKELAAARVHYLSARWQNPFVTLNCASLSPSLLESELFGHEAGAFTGATQRRKGRFEMAHEGTLFLDEIGTMPMIVQEKILRVIEYRSFERVGGSTPLSLDVRIVAATNADLPALCREAAFKQDLLDRLSFEVVTLPPLRERTEDIMPLASHFAAQMAVELGMSDVPAFSDEVARQLLAYHWPGNIRELKNTIEREVYKSSGGKITGITLNPFQAARGEHTSVDEKKSRFIPGTDDMRPDCAIPLPRAVRELEVRYLKAALEKAKFNQKRAATLLGLTYHQFRGLYRKHGKECRDL